MATLKTKNQGAYSQYFIFFVTYEWAQQRQFVTLHWAGKACQGQKPQLIEPIFKLQKMKCCEYDPQTSRLIIVICTVI
jgi:hypothetical protein